MPETALNSPPLTAFLMPFGPTSRTVLTPGTATTARAAPPGPALSVCHVSPLFCVRKSPPRTSSA